MKQYILLWIGLLGLLQTPLHAQRGLTLIGIKAGASVSGLWGRSVNDSLSTGGRAGSLGGITLGVGINSMINDHVWLKHEALLTGKGASLKLMDENKAVYSSRLNLTYLDVYPCSFTYHNRGWQAFAGPYIGMLLGASIQRRDGQGNRYTDKTIFGTPTASKGYTQRIDAGFVLGMEYELPTGLNVGFRYVRGFVPLIENPLAQSGQARIYNQNLNLTVGYTFGKQ